VPWRASDSKEHTKKADTPKKRRLWSAVANDILERTGDEGRAIRGANAKVADTPASDKPVSLADMMTATVKARKKKGKK
jgi:hypothetical protein